MPENRYWDTAAFIAVLKEEEGRAEKARTVLAAAEAGDIRIYTSALTLCEILWPKGMPSGKAAKKANRDLIREVMSHSFVRIIQLDRTVAELAQDVVWEFGVKPKDAVHVASALRANIRVFHTFDDGLLKKDGLIGDPPLHMEIPYIPPDEQLALIAEEVPLPDEEAGP